MGSSCSLHHDIDADHLPHESAVCLSRPPAQILGGMRRHRPVLNTFSSCTRRVRSMCCAAAGHIISSSSEMRTCGSYYHSMRLINTGRRRQSCVSQTESRALLVEDGDVTEPLANNPTYGMSCCRGNSPFACANSPAEKPIRSEQ
jgi:hypothetical protein